MRDNVVQIRQIGQELACVQCGSIAHATCDCGVAYEPASSKIAAHPEWDDLSDGVVAEKLGVSRQAVNKARKSTDNRLSVDKRVGLDGKERRVPQRRERDEEYEEPNNIEADVDPENYRTAYFLRADQAIRFASYSGTVDDEVIAFAKAVAKAWTKLAQDMEKNR